MSTRANIEISYGETKIMLYRHHDGYPAVTGRNICKNLWSAWNPWERGGKEVFLSQMINQTSGDKRCYSLTDDIHGDVEYFYKVEFMGEGKIWITISHNDAVIIDTPDFRQVELFCEEEANRMSKRYQEMTKKEVANA